MQAFVITIMDNERSVQVAERCIKSGARHGIDIEMFPATTPADRPLDILKELGIPPNGFASEYSKERAVQSTFLSHYRLWEKALEETTLILEHDAVITSKIPEEYMLGSVTSLGAPSYGRFNIPPMLGLNTLCSKPYFPGAHGYVVKPTGAKKLLEKAKVNPGPADIFLGQANFGWLQEWYPWPIECRDSFTTIQKTRGCEAKHNYKKGPDNFDIIEP